MARANLVLLIDRLHQADIHAALPSDTIELTPLVILSEDEIDQSRGVG